MNQLIQKGVDPMRKKRKRKPGGNPKGKSAPPYPFEFKLKLVRLHLEDGYGVPMLAQEFGVSAMFCLPRFTLVSKRPIYRPPTIKIRALF
jgi:hypothetical protein